MIAKGELDLFSKESGYKSLLISAIFERHFLRLSQRCCLCLRLSSESPDTATNPFGRMLE